METKRFVVPEIQVSYVTPSEPKLWLKNSVDIYILLKKVFDKGHLELREEFVVLYFAPERRLLGLMRHTIGTATSCPLDYRVIIATAIKANAAGIVLAHNHTSGDVDPTTRDFYITQRLDCGARFFDIEIMDHLIIGRHWYHSFADSGELFRDLP
jgi:DNA repair protein RadC